MELIRDFSKIGRNDAMIAGGKGASLGEMTQVGIPVPPGFVILSQAFNRFITETGISAEIDANMHTVRHGEIHTVDNASEKIKNLILDAEMPADIAREIEIAWKKLGAKYVAVRSSATAEDGATAAWAGQLESYLNTTEKSLLEKVKHCWASLFTPRAIFYRFEKFGSQTHLQRISVAVVVQKMVESEVSGIAFSVHPVTEDYNQIIIEAGLGLGEAIVSGQITPDSYVVEKVPQRIIDKNITVQNRGLFREEGGGNVWKDIPEELGAKPALHDEQIFELSNLILKIESHYGFPCDIEWAFEEGKFYIVQSRPITTLTPVKTQDQENLPNSSSAKEDFSPRQDLSGEYLKLIGKRKLYPPLNTYSAFLLGSGFNTKKYLGRWYENKTKLDVFIHMKTGFSQGYLTDDDVRFSSTFALKEYLRNPKIFERRLVNLGNIEKINKIYEENTYAVIAQKKWNDLLSLMSEVRDIMWDANASVFFSIYLDKQMCEDIIKEEKFPLSQKELDALWEKAIEPAFESFDKSQMIHFLTLVRDGKSWMEIVEECQYFLSDYHSAKTLAEVEKFLKEHFLNYIGNPKVVSEALKIETEHVRETIHRHEEWMKKLNKNERAIVDYVQVTMKARDHRKNPILKTVTIMCRIAERMFAEVGMARDLVPFYTVEEFLKGKEYLKLQAGELEKRKNGFQWFVPYEGEPRGLAVDIDPGVEKLSKYFTGSHLSGNKTDVIEGQTGAKGIARGRVRIVLNVNSDHGFSNGEILVTGMTRPEYVPLMKKAAGIVTDEGGITCHAAIVSRELGIPCVIGTKIATTVLKDGDMVEVDADKGIVRKI